MSIHDSEGEMDLMPLPGTQTDTFRSVSVRLKNIEFANVSLVAAA